MSGFPGGSAGTTINDLLRQHSRAQSPDEKRTLRNSTRQILLDSDSAVHEIINGGVRDSIRTGLPTGIILAPPLPLLHWYTSHVDWSAYMALDGSLARDQYLASIFVAAPRAATTDTLRLLGHDSIHLLHLNSYLNVPLYSSEGLRGALARINPSYGFPGAYVALANRDADGFSLTIPSLDIIRQRQRQGQIYNRGYLFHLPPGRHCFFFDRKACLALHQHFIKEAARRLSNHTLLPSDHSVAEHADQLMTVIESTLSDEAFLQQVYLPALSRLMFGILGACLFEVLHEFVSMSGRTVLETHEFMCSVDESQGSHWSLRSFMGSYPPEEVQARISDHLGDKGAAFWAYFGLHIKARLSGYLCNGDTALQAMSACAYVSLVHGRESEGNHAAQELISTAATVCGAHLLRIMAGTEAGPICVPFQPDNRGELLLTPLLEGGSSDLVLIGEQTLGTGYRLVIEQSDVRARVHTELDVSDNSLRAQFFSGHLTPAENSIVDRYQEHLSSIFGDTIEPAAQECIRTLDSVAVKSPIVVVVIPFFKERHSFISAAIDSASAILRMGRFPLMVMVSNQPTIGDLRGSSRRFPESVGMLELCMGKALGCGLGRDWFVTSIQTDRARDLRHWMIEKYLNVHCGALFSRELTAGLKGPAQAIERIVFLEADVEGLGKWWEVLADSWTHQPAVELFEFDVSVRPEGSSHEPICDLHNSDALLARFVAEPLTGEALGVPIRQLFGGNYSLHPDALDHFVRALDKSKHYESLVEFWLPSVAARCTSSEHRLGARHVGDKVHLPALHEHFYSTAEKFSKWTLDAFASLFLAIQSGLDGAHIRGAELHPVTFRLVDALSGAASLITTALQYRRDCRGIYDGVFKPVEGLAGEWNAVAKSIGENQPPAYSEDLWSATICAFFLYFFRHPTMKRSVRDEMMVALRSLFFLTLTTVAKNGNGSQTIPPWIRCEGPHMRLLRPQLTAFLETERKPRAEIPS